jgi:D-alanyl-D-alanine carboxypeptidase/D-alanyl-D-alanine-endopeptidase (penicillin-binding protein 4)
VAARLATAAALAVLVLAAPAAADIRTLDRSLAAALDEPGLAAPSSTAMVVELPSGRVLYARNPDLSLEPASNEKLCVTYTSLVELGPSFRFPTEVLGEGVRDGSTWRGSLVLKGFGDPTLTSARLTRMAGILWREGIRKVTGAIVGDATFFDADATAPGWLPSFAGLESPPLSALVVDRADDEGRLVSDPPLAAAIDFAAILRARGIATGRARSGGAGSSAKLLLTTYSDPLAQVLEYMDTYSDNFTAEMVLKEIGAQVGGAGTTASGAKVVREVLGAAGVPLAGVRIVDGSGLSRLDRVTAAELSTLLVRIWTDPVVRQVALAGLPVAGETGTLEYRMTTPPARGVVHAKTGTTDIASALSGFVGGRYAFVAIENGYPVNPTAAHAAQDRFAATLAAQLAATG